MDVKGLYINIGINGSYYTHALLDSGCLTYRTISNRFARHLNLQHIPIKPHTLQQVNTLTKDAISKVAYIDINIDGYKRRRIFFYIIPNQEDDVLLRLA
jgi:hypothetical protein